MSEEKFITLPMKIRADRAQKLIDAYEAQKENGTPFKGEFFGETFDDAIDMIEKGETPFERESEKKPELPAASEPEKNRESGFFGWKIIACIGGGFAVVFAFLALRFYTQKNNFE